MVTQRFSVGHGAGPPGARRRRLTRLCIGLAILPLLGACNEKNAYVPPPPPKVSVAHPLRQAVTRYFELTGNTQAFQTVDLEARVQGFLEAISYEDGASVAKGTPLFTIQQDTYQAQLQQAKSTLASDQAALENAKSQYSRQSTLGKQDFASQANVEDAKTKLDQASAEVLQAQASLDLATINLGYTTISAPFDGIVTNHLADVGALVGVSGPTKLATITQVDPLYVYFSVSEAQVLLVKQELAKQGRKITDIHAVHVEIGLQSETGYPHVGTLDYVSPQVDPATGTLLLRGLFGNQDRALLPGLFVRVRVPVGHDETALLIPDDAIGTGQEGSYALVVGSDNQVAQRVVKLGQRQGRMRVVESGLDANDWVITDGLQRAAPGSKVDPQQIAAANDTAPAENPDVAPKP